MQPVKFLIFIICAGFLLQTHAQEIKCDGSLGDPVINQNFGAGTNPGKALSGGMTNMSYTTNNCPNDGEYTIANSLTGSGNCHPNTWHNVLSDHTGNPNGYMMIVNASLLPSIFFTQPAGGLCPNTTYQFSAYVLNLITLAASRPGISQPNITFSIQTTSGKVLKTENEGFPPTSTPQWVQYATYFTTPADATDVVVTMTNNAPGGDGNDLILDDITFRACGPIIQSGISSITGGSNTSICQGTDAVYNLQAAIIGDNNPVYQWQSNYNGGAWTDVSGGANNALTVNFSAANPAGSYQYRLGVANGSIITDAACRVYSTPLTITVNPLPVVPPIPAPTVCETYPLTLTASGGASYIWTGPNLAPTSQNPLVINNVTMANAGTYSVVALSDKGCPAPPVTVNVAVIPNIVPAISPDVSICAGESTQLASSGGKYYKWTPATGLDHDDTPNPVASPLQTTTYTVGISNDGCSNDSKSVTVTVNQNPVADAGSNKKIFEGQSVKLDGSIKGDNITSYFWTPETFLDDPKSLTPVATPTEDITYTLNLISHSCGTSSSNVFVRVYKKIAIPNAFSPNNDGVNDYWNIKELYTYPDCSLAVYNRYGQQIYQSTGYSKPWDGGYNGSPLPAGTYYYILDLKNNTPKISGWVLLVR